MSAGSSRKFFVESVIPKYVQFIEWYNGRVCGNDKNLAADAAETLLNLPEYVFLELGIQGVGYPSYSEYRNSFWDKHQFYRIVCDVANASKHKEITRKGSLIDGYDSVSEQVALVRYTDKHGRYYISRKLLLVRLKDGRQVDLADQIWAAFTLWTQELKAKALIPADPVVPELLPKFVTRDDPRFQVAIQLKGLAGEPLDYQLTAGIYRSELGSFTIAGKDEKFGTAKTPLQMLIEKSPF